VVGLERISLDDTVVDSVRRGRRDFSHGLTEAGLTHDKLGHFLLLCGLQYMIFWIIFAYLRGDTIVYCFRILKRVNQLLGFSLPHTTVFQYLRGFT
jgi:hypothetical protein